MLQNTKSLADSLNDKTLIVKAGGKESKSSRWIEYRRIKPGLLTLKYELEDGTSVERDIRSITVIGNTVLFYTDTGTIESTPDNESLELLKKELEPYLI